MRENMRNAFFVSVEFKTAAFNLLYFGGFVAEMDFSHKQRGKKQEDSDENFAHGFIIFYYQND